MQYQIKHLPRILSGKSTQKTIKNYLINIRENKCEICNIKEWLNKPLTLHMDHIDGNTDNNFINNLRLLCPNCHSQTETYTGRNIKNSKRQSYMKKYRKVLEPDGTASVLHTDTDCVRSTEEPPIFVCN